jgi:hypothetical protein
MKQVLFQWDGEAMIPATGFMQRRCDEQFTVGDKYVLVQHQDRTQQSEGHYFATLRDLWENLPEHLSGEPWAETDDHLRKFALIKTGFCDVETFPCGSKAEAERWAARLKPMDEYAIVKIVGTVVHRYRAKSQSRQAMPGKGDFQRSKVAVLDYVSDLVGLPKDAEQRRAA